MSKYHTLCCAGLFVASTICGYTIRAFTWTTDSAPHVGQDVAKPSAVLESFTRPNNAVFHSMRKRNESWKAAIREAARTSLLDAFELFNQMPVSSSPVLQLSVLQELFGQYGPEALSVAVSEGVDLKLCLDALRQAELGMQSAFLNVMFSALGNASARPLNSEGIASLMRYLRASDSETLGIAISGLKKHLNFNSLDEKTLSSLAACADPATARALIDCLQGSWLKSLFTCEVLQAAGTELGNQPDKLRALEHEFGDDAGISQSQEFAAKAVTAMAVAGHESEAMGRALAYKDTLQREAATASLMSYLRQRSPFAALTLLASREEWLRDDRLVTLATSSVKGPFVDGARQELDALYQRAADNKVLAEIISHAGWISLQE